MATSESMILQDESIAPIPSTSSQPAEPASNGFEDFGFYDIFFWRDAPDWYRKTFLSTGFGLSYCALKQYMSRQELEVFLPPRSKVLPKSLQEGYRNSQMLKYGFLKVGKEVTTIAGCAATYYAGAFYLGEARGVHSWENFAASGAAAGMGLSWWMLTPFKPRATLFGGLLGAALGSVGAISTTAFGFPLWDMSHDFEGYIFGRRVNLRNDEPGCPGAPTPSGAGADVRGSSSGGGGGSSSGGASGGVSGFDTASIPVFPVKSAVSTSTATNSGSQSSTTATANGTSSCSDSNSRSGGSGQESVPTLPPAKAAWGSVFTWRKSETKPAAT
ncbi:MAG: hypothetical protein WDW38_006072 [Sanguina aurantia]